MQVQATASPDGARAVSVRVARRNRSSLRAYAHTPRLAKSVREGWWLVVADRDSNELLALKRITCRHSCEAVLELDGVGTKARGRALRGVVHLVSDCYVGLDVACDFLLE